MKIKVKPDSLAFRIYRQLEIEEPFNCNYELNPDYQKRLEASGLEISGNTEDGGIRIVELPANYFFLATGYTPQLASEEGDPHPLINGFLKAAAEYKGDISG